MGTPNQPPLLTLRDMPIRVKVRYFAGLRRLIGLGEEAYMVEEETELRSLLMIERN